MKRILNMFLALTLCSYLAVPSYVYTAEKQRLFDKSFTQEDWKDMDKNVQQLKDSYNNLKTKVDIKTVRQKIHVQAQDNPVFTHAYLFREDLSLVYKEVIPIILELPGPNSHLYD